MTEVLALQELEEPNKVTSMSCEGCGSTSASTGCGS
ncbi:hypothetical protein P3T36_005266 [Kitasatospora sp. MAP12-15]|nr:hypothetical protein [Kitasatospora sp. MAP12-44]